jgi:hypothetical protein
MWALRRGATGIPRAYLRLHVWDQALACRDVDNVAMRVCKLCEHMLGERLMIDDLAI